MKIKHIAALAALTLPMSANAQSINFENNDYKSLGVYDTWTESPFRKGLNGKCELKGNYDVIANHLKGVDPELGVAPNTSEKILAVQRSRFGSNTFGVRVDLKETFELTTTTKYVHVLVNRPYEGRVMVIGLGKRQDRPGQSPDTEQFWAMSTSNVPADRWYEVVLPIKGNGGIDIHSLVIVPDCESRHNDDVDKICYIDDIEVNNDPTTKHTYGYYQTNFDKEQEKMRDDRFLSGIYLTTDSEVKRTVNATTSSKLYHYVEDTDLRAKAGETLTPRFKYNGIWMHGYVYMDLNQNGRFEAPVNENMELIKEGSELFAYSFYGGKNGEAGYNSAGQFVTGNDRSQVDPPSFTLPADVKPGFYRMRYKVDWNSVDPGGCIDPSNSIINNGGGIMDVRINVHEDEVQVNSANRNGAVLKSDETNLDGVKVPFNKPLRIKVVPSNGFSYTGVVIKHGYNLNADSVQHDVKQWSQVTIDASKFDKNNEFEIPAEYMDGNVEIEGVFVSEGNDPANKSRYEVTTVTDQGFAETTTWYTMQIGRDGYVIYYAPYSTYFSLYTTTLMPEEPAHQWCFTGNEKDGYKVYNRAAGPKMVLAASTDMSALEGGRNYARMYNINEIPEGYISTWRFMDSNDLGSTSVEYAYMYQDGHPENKLNNRDNMLAFWTGGQDAGSTLQIRLANGAETGIQNVEADDEANAVYYDISGRRVLNPTHGVYIRNGKKIVR